MFHSESMIADIFMSLCGYKKLVNSINFKPPKGWPTLKDFKGQIYRAKLA